ncbi:MAG: MBOAT family protein, partial [Bacilli bacterium]|nr:MBOAT family protein [Bacilli bacterium]
MSWQSVFFIAFTTLSIYGLSLLISRNKNKESEYLTANKETLSKEDKKAYKAKNKRIRKTYLILGILSNVAALAVMKYLNFFIGNINTVMSWFHSSNRLGLVNIFLPLGISFYTFQAIGYIVDVYWNKFPA